MQGFSPAVLEQKGKTLMNRRLVATVGALVFCATAWGWGAGKSDVADAAMKGDRAAVRALVAQKADVNAPQVDGATALHWAMYRNDAEMADVLIRAGANVKAANRDGVTPLAMAALYGNPAMILKLLKAGADGKEVGTNGQTVLMLAARNGNPDAVKVLIEGGANVNARETLRGTTALMWAVEQKHPAAVKALLAGGADVKLKSAGAGLPRNYLAPRVNTAAVKQAAERYARAAANGRTYEEQLKWERDNGQFSGPPTIGEQLARLQSGSGCGSGRGRAREPAAGGGRAGPRGNVSNASSVSGTGRTRTWTRRGRARCGRSGGRRGRCAGRRRR